MSGGMSAMAKENKKKEDFNKKVEIQDRDARVRVLKKRVGDLSQEIHQMNIMIADEMAVRL